MADASLSQIEQVIERDIDKSIDWLARLVKQPSVAAQNLGIKECADLVASMLTELGYTAEVHPTNGSPVVYGEGGKGDKTLLFYNHYDVQPAEPFELWESPPFELTRKGDMLIGRGISDDKGHIVTRLAALAAVKEVLGELPCKVKFVIEGEEEVSSEHLPGYIEANQQKLAADACIWEFGGVDFQDRFEHYLGMRGICYVELSVKTASRDSHSGLGGSLFPNAAWRLVWALSTLKDQNERILIPGYYDSVVPASPTDMELLSEIPDDHDRYKQTYGLSAFLKGETDNTELNRMEVFEPTCTICGLSSGYQLAGAKTVLPAEASAKVDFRLVPNQSPEETVEKLRKHLDAQGFSDVEVKMLGGEKPARTDPDDSFVHLVGETAKRIYPGGVVIRPMIGGSGPNHPFIHTLGLPVAMAGIGYPDTRAHAPNENVLVSHLLRGIKHTAHILVEFAKS